MQRVMVKERFDLIVLDLMLPGEDGLTVCKRMRASKDFTPIIMLTAKGEDVDRIIGLELGADDYLAKPFNPRELIARARAVLRRAQITATLPPAQPGAIRFEGWTFEPASRALMNPEGATVELSAGEYDLLCALVEHPQRVLTRDFLMDWTKGRGATPFDRAIDVALSRLRRKLRDDPQSPRLIRTVRNGGYLFAARVERS
jgi:two-component system OmpR family response regulator